MRSLVCVFLVAAPLHSQQQAAAAVPTLHVTGRLLDGEGAPVVGAKLTGGPIDALVTGDALDRPQATSGADGRFAITIRVDHERLLTSYVGLLAVADGRAAIRWGGHLTPYNPMTFRTNDARGETGDLVMARGTRLRGRVSDEHGKPIAGAYVRAIDLLTLDEFFPSRPAWFTATVSGEDGAFTLVGVPDMPVAVLVRAEGYFDRIVKGVDLGREAELSLRKSGTLSGALVGPDGNGVRGRVFVDYEGYNPGYRWDLRHRRTAADSIMPCQVADTSASGEFEVAIRFPGYFRLRARGAVSRHDVVDRIRNTGARGLRLQLPASASQPVIITAKDESTGKPIPQLAGIGHWPKQAGLADDAALAAIAASYRLLHSGPDGELRLPGPPEGYPGRGSLRVHAPGYAPKFVPAIDVSNDRKRKLELSLTPESSIAGRVAGKTLDQPIANAEVVCTQLLPDKYGQAAQVPDTIRVVTARDGSFRIAGLGAGRMVLRVTADGYQFEPVRVVLDDEEHETGLVIHAAETVRVSGKLLSSSVQPGWQLQLSGKYTRHRYDPDVEPSTYFWTRAQVDITKNRNFEFPAQIPGEYRVSLLVPHPFRIYFGYSTELSRFELSAPARKLEIPVPRRIVSTFQGRVRIKDSVIPNHRLVIAGFATDRTANPTASYNDPRATLRSAPHAPVRADGSFVLPVPSKEYRLHVYDAVTSVRLHRTEVIDATTKPVHDIDLELVVCKSVVTLRGSEDRPAECTSMRIVLPDEKNDPPAKQEGARLPPGLAPTGAYMWLGDRPKQVVLYTPPGRVELVASTGIGWLLEPRRFGNNGLGKCEFRAVAGKVVRVPFAVDSLPEFEGRSK